MDITVEAAQNPDAPLDLSGDLSESYGVEIDGEQVETGGEEATPNVVTIGEDGTFQLPGWDEPMSAKDFNDNYISKPEYTRQRQQEKQELEQAEGKLIEHAQGLARERATLEAERAAMNIRGPQAPQGPPGVASPQGHFLSSVAKHVSDAGYWDEGSFNALGDAMNEHVVGPAFSKINEVVAAVNNMVKDVESLQGGYSGIQQREGLQLLHTSAESLVGKYPWMTEADVTALWNTGAYKSLDGQFSDDFAQLAKGRAERHNSYLRGMAETNRPEGIPVSSGSVAVPTGGVGDEVASMSPAQIADRVIAELNLPVEGERLTGLGSGL